MNRLQLLLGKLAEEASEVAQIALKTQQFGLYEKRPGQLSTNAERCHQELNDLLTIVEMLNDEFGFGFKTSRRAIGIKKKKVEKYAQYSIELGLVTTVCKEMMEPTQDLNIKLLPGKVAPRYASDIKQVMVTAAVVTEQGTTSGLPIVDFQMRDSDGNEYFFCLTGRIFNMLSTVVKGVNLRNHGVEEP